MNVAALGDMTSMFYCSSATNKCEPNIKADIVRDSQTKEISSVVTVDSMSQEQIVCGKLNGNNTVVCSEPFIYDNFMLKSVFVEADTDMFLGSNVARSTFESLVTLDSINIPDNAISSWDVSEKQNGSIMAWYTDNDNNGKYELYIGQDGGVKANPTSGYLFSYFTNMTNMDLSHLNTSNVVNARFMFAQDSSIINLDLSSFDTSNMKTIMDMFWFASSLETVNLSSFNTSNVDNMWGLFNEASSLKSVDLSNFDTSNTRIMNLMFQNCKGLTSLDLSNFDTSKVTNMANMFAGAKKLTNLNISSFDTSNVTNMSAMFSGLSSLTSLDVSHFDTSNVTSMRSMFNEIGLANLDLSNFDTSSVKNMHSLFWSSSRLESVNLSGFNTSNVTDMYAMFLGTKITNLDLSSFDTSKVTTMEDMFKNTTVLQKLKFNKATFNSIENYNNMFVNSKISEITVKDEDAKSFIQNRLNDANVTTATIIIE